MLSKLLLAWCLMALCVVIHASAVTSAMQWVRRHPAKSQQFWVWTWLFVRVAGWMILFHLIEIFVWALSYVWLRAMPDVQSALYFSVVTYTTTLCYHKSGKC